MKGDIKLVKCFGSVGSVVRDYKTQEVIAGSYRHQQTVDGTTYSWKCAALSLTGVVKLVEDSFDDNGTQKVFYRMEGLVSEVAQATKVQETFSALDNFAW